MNYLKHLIAAAKSRDAKYDDDDVNLASLLTPHGYKSEHEEHRATDCIRNITRPLTQFLEDVPSEDTTSMRHDLFRQKKSHVLSVYSTAWDAFLSLQEIRMRQPARDLIKTIDSEHTSAETKAMLADYAHNDEISALDFLKFEVDRRYSNPGWRRQIQQGQMSEAAMMREVAQLFAVNAKLQERISSIHEKARVVHALRLNEDQTSQSKNLMNQYTESA